MKLFFFKIEENMNNQLFFKLLFSFIFFCNTSILPITIASKLSKRSAKELAQMENSIFGSENPYDSEMEPNQEPIVKRVFLLEKRLQSLEALVKSWGDVPSRVASGSRRQSSGSRQ